MIAEILTETTPIFQLQPHWWLCQPLNVSIPDITFAISKNAPLLDNYKTGWDIELYSERMINIIESFGVSFEIFPANIVDYKTGEKINATYKIFHLLEIYKCADLKRSKDGHIILSEECINRGRYLFRLGEAPQLVLIHKDLQDALESNQITGCEYNPLSEYQNTTLLPDFLSQ
jgi:hypothetical protein